MKVLVLSTDGTAIPIGHRLQQEGHKVSVCLTDPKYIFSGLGIVDRVSSWRPLLAETDFVIITSPGFDGYKQVFFKYGIPVFGCTPELTTKIETHDAFISLAEQLNLNYPEHQFIDSDSLGITHMADWNSYGYTLIIPATNNEYKIDTPEELTWLLNTHRDYTKILRDNVPGTEVTITGLFNGRSWISPYIVSSSISFSRKYMEGDIIVTDLLEMLSPALQEVGHRGFIQIKAVIDEGYIHILDLSQYIDHNVISVILEGVKDNLCDILFEVAQGVRKSFSMTRDCIATAALSHNDNVSSRPLHIPEIALSHLTLTNVMKQLNQFLTSNSTGYFLSASARGRSPAEARSRLNRTLSNISFESMTYDRKYLETDEQDPFLKRIQNA